jgi:MFS family permease
MLATLYSALPLLFGVRAGRLADTVMMRIPLFIGSGLGAVAMLCGYARPQLAMLFVIAAITGVGYVYFNVAVQNLAGHHGHPEDRPRNFTGLMVSYSLSNTAGPVLAGLLYDHLGGPSAFLAFAALTGLPAVLLVVHPAFARYTRPASPAHRRVTMDLLRAPALRRLIAMSGLMIAAYELYGFYLPALGNSLGLSAQASGFILGIYSLATFISRLSLPLLSKVLSPSQILVPFMLLGAAGFVLMPYLGEAGPLMLVSFIVGAGTGVCQPLAMSLTFDESPVGRTGEVTGLRLTVNNLSRTLIGPLAGALGSLLGLAPVFWMMALNLFAVGWLARGLKELSRSSSPAPGRVAP